MRSTGPMKSAPVEGRWRPTGPGPLMKSMRSQQQQGMLLDIFDEIMGSEVRRRARSSSPDSRGESRGFPRREGGSVTSRPANEKVNPELINPRNSGGKWRDLPESRPGGPAEGSRRTCIPTTQYTTPDLLSSFRLVLAQRQACPPTTRQGRHIPPPKQAQAVSRGAGLLSSLGYLYRSPGPIVKIEYLLQYWVVGKAT